MAKRSTRNKIRHQAISAWEDLKRAQDHMVGIYALADDRHQYVEDNLPVIIASLEALMDAYELFNEGL